MEIGGFMGTPTTIVDENTVGTERLWSDLQEFLSDPTVNWVKDTTIVKAKLLATRTDPDSSIEISPLDPLTRQARVSPNTALTYEIESSRKAIYLRQRFSYAKHFGDKNYMKNATFFDLGTPGDTGTMTGPNDVQSFKIRTGYIAFDNVNKTSIHVPIDRIPDRHVEYTLQQNVRLRDPAFGPRGSNEEQLAKMAMLQQLIQSQTQDIQKPEWEKIDEQKILESDYQSDEDESDYSESEDPESEGEEEQEKTI
eukprot:GDKJ01030948.1.p1 GENE.GDKJ01030948.1~~GDKJ01030948.1.p1  ORF type:complete len:266 (+),score=-0.42 GDKJ01030948.1:40-798(+)